MALAAELDQFVPSIVADIEPAPVFPTGPPPPPPQAMSTELIAVSSAMRRECVAKVIGTASAVEGQYHVAGRTSCDCRHP